MRHRLASGGAFQEPVRRVHGRVRRVTFTLPGTALTWVINFLLIDLLYYCLSPEPRGELPLAAAYTTRGVQPERGIAAELVAGPVQFWFYVPVAVLGASARDPHGGAFVTLYQF
jgi:hypothetical protein